jgi:lipoyl(octanoyl) transferase
MSPWRLLLHPELPGFTQMAMDEALLTSLGPDSSPILRFYSWRRPVLSLGRFQRYKSVVHDPFCVHNNIDVVRRLTGGRAVLHHLEVTYAVVARLDRGLFENHSLHQTYRRIAEALNLGLKMMGVDKALIALAPGTGQDHPRAAAGQCFVSISRYEIGERARKIIGSAQRRMQDRFLQHGSILLDFDPALQSGCVLAPDPAIESKIAPLNALTGRPLAFEEVASAFASGFERALSVELIRGEITDAEAALTRELETLYAGDTWTRDGCR